MGYELWVVSYGLWEKRELIVKFKHKKERIAIAIRSFLCLKDILLFPVEKCKDK